ncbi:hypothetical protein, partial [Enterococcus canintestini]|uniref:hypothetical protein n=1 Tax=Enterococcus canintestini TaxID=317010 RepID=UPI003993BF1C
IWKKSKSCDPKKGDKMVRRFLLVMGILFVMGGISGCGSNESSLQEQYQKELETQSKMNSGTIDLTIDSLSIRSDALKSSEERHLMEEMIEKQFTGVTLKGTYLRDKKSENQSAKFELDAFGEKTPVTLYSEKKTKSVFVSAESYNAFMMIGSQFFSLPVHSIDTEEITGKYLVMTPKEVVDATEITNRSVIEYVEKLSEYVESLDKDSFKKDGDKLSHSFTKKEIENFLSKQKDQQEKYVDEIKKFDKLTIDLTLDTKKHTKNGKITAKKTANGSSTTIKMTMKQSVKNSDKTVKLPKNADRIDFEDFLQQGISSVQVK